MADEDKTPITDIFGIAPYGRALEKVTDAAIQAAGAVLGRIFLPGAEEYGLLLKDKVSNWRTRNFISTMKKLEQKLEENKVPDGSHAHPRLVHAIVEEAEWIEDSMVQDMWAGLLSSSCTEDGDDDSNLIFTNLLGNLTKIQARIVRYAAENARRQVTPSGLIQALPFVISTEKLVEVTGEKDLQRLDRELDNLRDVGLLHERSGLSHDVENMVYLTPSGLALHMYVRCCGSRSSPLDYFGLAEEKPAESQP